MSFAQAFAVTTEEGGSWQKWRPGKFRNVHTVIFENGYTWDCYVGARKHPKAPAEMKDIHASWNALGEKPELTRDEAELCVTWGASKTWHEKLELIRERRANARP